MSPETHLVVNYIIFFICLIILGAWDWLKVSWWVVALIGVVSFAFALPGLPSIALGVAIVWQLLRRTMQKVGGA
jgi:hypothetical protein